MLLGFPVLVDTDAYLTYLPASSGLQNVSAQTWNDLHFKSCYPLGTCHCLWACVGLGLQWLNYVWYYSVIWLMVVVGGGQLHYVLAIIRESNRSNDLSEMILLQQPLLWVIWVCSVCLSLHIAKEWTKVKNNWPYTNPVVALVEKSTVSICDQSGDIEKDILNYWCTYNLLFSKLLCDNRYSTYTAKEKART